MTCVRLYDLPTLAATLANTATALTPGGRNSVRPHGTGMPRAATTCRPPSTLAAARFAPRLRPARIDVLGTGLRRSSLLLTVTFALLPAFAIGADIAAGQAKVKEVCQACHGIDGNSQTPDYPKLGGQYPDYLAKALRDYKSGARKNPIMAGFAGTLTTKDIENVAAYYASQPAVLAKKY